MNQKNIRRKSFGGWGGLLLLVAGVATAQDGFEPDNLPFQATSLPTSGIPQIHDLAPLGDFDLYKITLNRQATLYFELEVLDPKPKAIIGLGLFESNLPAITTAAELLDTAVYIRLSAPIDQFGDVVRTVSLRPGTYFAVVVPLMCDGGPECKLAATYRISASALDLPDRYEPDDSPEAARWIDVNGPEQVHNLASDADEDWTAFYETDAGMELLITVFRAGADVAPLVTLYGTDAATILATSTVADLAGDTISLSYTTTANDIGILYVVVTSATKAEAKSESSSFVLSVTTNTSVLPSSLAGVVKSTRGVQSGCSTTFPPIANASVFIQNLGNVSTVSDANGAYAFASIPGGTYSVRATAAGFQEITAGSVSVGASVTTLNFSLAPTKSSAVTSALSALADGNVWILAATLLLTRRSRAPNRRLSRNRR
ncbi:MAG: carboxypeptidase regulatory-like domain-containing protein [Candidatus Hydrogenedentes bacterium]|nr:carboxypeptidase regulatory-like domain-containing protein [Candidatus Hydrogenedentota bacterium]